MNTFAHVSDPVLAEMAREYEHLEETGTLPDDALLRRHVNMWGMPPVDGLLFAGLFAYRELAKRHDLIRRGQQAWQRYEDAPTDGTPILVDDGGEIVAQVSFHAWTAEEREELPESEQDTEGFWQYDDSLLSDVHPGGPEVPFRWARCPNLEE
jgi:hypothetical protein